MARGMITSGSNPNTPAGNNYAEIENLKMRALMDAGARPFASALANTGYQGLQALQLFRPDRNTWSQALQDTIGGWNAYRDVKGWGDKSWEGQYGGTSQMSGLGVLDWARREQRKNIQGGGGGTDWNKFRWMGADKVFGKAWDLRAKAIGIDPFELATQAQARYGVHDVLGELKTDNPSGNIRAGQSHHEGSRDEPSRPDQNVAQNIQENIKKVTKPTRTTKPTRQYTNVSYQGDPTGRKPKPFAFEDVKARASRPTTPAPSTTPVRRRSGGRPGTTTTRRGYIPPTRNYGGGHHGR
jgi:hypothetical protein